MHPHAPHFLFTAAGWLDRHRHDPALTLQAMTELVARMVIENPQVGYTRIRQVLTFEGLKRYRTVPAWPRTRQVG